MPSRYSEVCPTFFTWVWFLSLFNNIFWTASIPDEYILDVSRLLEVILLPAQQAVLERLMHPVAPYWNPDGRLLNKIPRGYTFFLLKNDLLENQLYLGLKGRSIACGRRNQREESCMSFLGPIIWSPMPVYQYENPSGYATA